MNAKSQLLRHAMCVGLLTAMMAAPVFAVTYYWDNNGTTNGFGTAGGTWSDSGSTLWNNDSTGGSTGAPNTLGTTVTTTTSDTLNFGNGTSNTLASGIITVSGTVSANTLAGSGPSSPAVITFSGGTIQFGTTANLSAGSRLTFEIESIISATNLSKTSTTGKITLSNAANNYSGTTTIIGGLSVTHLANGGASSSIGTSSNDAANLVIGTSSNNVGALIYIGSGDSTDRLFTSKANSAELGSDGTGAIKFTNPGAIAYGAIDANRSLILSGVNTDDNTLSAAISNNGTGVVSLTKSDAGTWILNGTNTYTGATNINGGMLQFGKLVSQSASSAVAVASGATLAVNLGGTGEWTTGASGNGTIGGLLAGLGGQSGGTVNYTGSVTLGFDTSNAGSAQTYSGDIANVGTTLGLRKLGTGTLVLSGGNTYTGATTINGGTLKFAKQASLYNNNTGSWTAANVKVRNGGTLALNVGGTNEFTAGNVTTLLANLGGANGTSTNGFAAGSSIGFDTTNASGGTFTVADLIADSTGTGGGAIGLTKLGAGKLVLSNTNTYSGATTVSAGTLYVTGALSNSAVTVQNGAAIGSNGAAGSLDAGLTINLGGRLDLTGATLGSTSSGVLTIANGQSLTLDQLTFQDLVGWDWANADAGTYQLIDGSFTINWGSTAYLDAGSAYDFGNGKKGYFESGSLNAVVFSIPEPRAALLGGLGVLLLLMRRRRSA